MIAAIAFCSSIYIAAIPSIFAHEYDCSTIVATLGITTFLLGFVLGPLSFAPLSSVRGRDMIFRLVLGLFVVFQTGCALAPNIASMIVFRFFSGFFGSPTVTNSGGSITDLWPQDNRSVPLALFSAASFLGPVIAPTVGGFICQYTLWRWDFWLVLILSSLCYIGMVIFLPETYSPNLLLDKQRRMPGYSPTNQPPVKELLYVSLTRPWQMLFIEPNLFLLSLYMALVYGILYLDFTAYPVVFRETRGWSASIAGPSFLGICVGMAVATLVSPYINHIHITSYLTDCYGAFGASALTANAVLCSLFGAVFPLLSTDLYHTLSVSWTTSLLGFVALIRARSKCHLKARKYDG
ncbi:major facilitator superfamily domain-containing protein [Aspergillus leporis]|uniref:Major facilitator superfamily domain-containing protein n=1 Tax=Aspergillus leporis TaxID=41062 RepID=A0A5N5WV99_9EURO|nr:major facilitator superfamily domain-containing protein [Aspergillus leporis]